MSSNAFLQPKEFYKRDINALDHYVKQMALGLSLENNIPFEEAKEFILGNIRNNGFPKMVNPVVRFFGRDHNLDRTTEEMPLTEYLKDVVNKREVLVPTFTAYCNVEEDKSPISVFIGENVKKRAIAKKAGQQADAEGNKELAFSKNIEQANKKENNNSMSGAFATDSSVFENETGHNTLTSITRSMASIGNALNERMIGGNRHYKSKDAIFNNILAIISSMDMQSTQLAMDSFYLHYPTPEEMIEVIRHSSKFYVFDKRVYEELLAFCYKLSPIQRASFCYNQDLYHLRQLNPQFVRQLLEDFARDDRTIDMDDPVGVINTTDHLNLNYAVQVIIFEMQGKGKKYHQLEPELQKALACACQNITSMVDKYRPLINAFFLTRTVPNSTAYIQDMVRQDVVLSDTDSTMFSTDEWVLWYFGKLDFSQRGFAISGAVMFLSTQCIAHCLAILSGNMGVAEENLYTLSMKPEFVFPVFVQSPVAKHYFTARLVEEGNVYPDIRMEIKGVHNKNSALPTSIIGPAQAKMEEIIRKIMKGERINLSNEIKEASNIERMIITSLLNSEIEYLKRSSIKEAGAYTRGPKESNYAFHTLWEQCFAPYYGHIDPPPYDVVKIPTTINTPSDFKNWLANMKNQQLAERIRNWAIEHNKKQITVFYFSLDKITSSAIPQEVVDVIDYKKIILDLTNVRRMLLDSLGHTCRQDFMLTELGY